MATGYMYGRQVPGHGLVLRLIRRRRLRVGVVVRRL